MNYGRDGKQVKFQELFMFNLNIIRYLKTNENIVFFGIDISSLLLVYLFVLFFRLLRNLEPEQCHFLSTNNVKLRCFVSHFI
jgi:hypothetical protein